MPQGHFLILHVSQIQAAKMRQQKHRLSSLQNCWRIAMLHNITEFRINYQDASRYIERLSPFFLLRFSPHPYKFFKIVTHQAAEIYFTNVRATAQGDTFSMCG